MSVTGVLSRGNMQSFIRLRSLQAQLGPDLQEGLTFRLLRVPLVQDSSNVHILCAGEREWCCP